MNERIKQLAEQAGLVPGGYANTPEKIMTWREQFDNPGSLEKFAELIVKECIDVATKDWYTPDGYGTVSGQAKAVEFIKEHFGIKEN